MIPLPVNKSRKRQPASWFCRRLKTLSRTNEVVGRMAAALGGDSIDRPRNLPPVTRIMKNPFR
jgi:hypothetical protein